MAERAESLKRLTLLRPQENTCTKRYPPGRRAANQPLLSAEHSKCFENFTLIFFFVESSDFGLREFKLYFSVLKTGILDRILSCIKVTDALTVSRLYRIITNRWGDLSDTYYRFLKHCFTLKSSEFGRENNVNSVCCVSALANSAVRRHY